MVTYSKINSKSKMVFQTIVTKLVYRIYEACYGNLMACKTENIEGF